MFDLPAGAWEEIGQDITNNTYLEELTLWEGVLNEQKMTSLFRGLTGSNSIKRISLSGDEQIFGVEGVRSMVPFLQNASNLKKLNVSENNIGSEGFNLLMRALSNSPIQELQCNSCGIESIEIDVDHIPKKLTSLSLCENDINADGCRGLGRLLQGVNSTLTFFSINENNIQSEGINSLWSALCNSPIKILSCSGCGIESIQIDDRIPKKLQILNLSDNMFSVEGCRRLAKLLRGTDSKLGSLNLENNNIDDEGVAIFVNALQDNKSLTHFYLIGNESISNEGKAMLLKLVNDISSIKATLKSNHTLEVLTVDECTEEDGVDDDSTSTRSSSSKETNGCLVKRYIKAACLTNKINNKRPVYFRVGANTFEPAQPSKQGAGQAKVIETQLDSQKRSNLCRLQGVDRSLYSEIDPLHLPEIFSLVGQNHGQKELFVALKSSVAGLISTVNKKQGLLQKRSYYEAKLKAINAEIAAIEEAESNVVDFGREKHSNKRLRK